MNNKYKITVEAPLIRAGLKIETEVSEKYLVAGLNTILDKVREFNTEPSKPTTRQEITGVFDIYNK